MRFRPCIDIKDGAVKQIVGGSIEEDLDISKVKENFVSDMSAASYAKMYRERGLVGGHIILLDKKGTKAYDADLAQAKEALREWPGAMQIGGGINDENAESFLDMGASHVIVTSYVFSDGRIRYDKLDEMKYVVGRKRLVLDLSARKKDEVYYVVTDRWQKFTDEVLTDELLYSLSSYCDEFLIHAVDVEGKKQGIDKDLLRILSEYKDTKITYAGGIRDMSDIKIIQKTGGENIDFTIGSALDIFGGDLSFDKLSKRYT